MIVLCSVSDRSAFKGTVYATTMKPIGGLPLIECLRPTAQLVGGIKGWRGYTPITDEQYTDGYRKLLAQRWPAVQAWLNSLSPAADLTLTCYCPRGTYCHRHLIAKLLEKHRPDIELLVR